ncbi:hypothetical protein [Dactylosporangium sp. NPDC000521]|uniref:hypothetical protein n=1 Tax=Dactylosporangium sp. NPDC000521 TaxID=3363975 RepID=UPI0036BB198D
MASPSVVKAPSALRRTTWCTSSVPGRAGFSTTTTCPGRTSSGATGAGTTGSPGAIPGRIEPVSTTWLSHPNATGTSVAPTQASVAAGRPARGF